MTKQRYKVRFYLRGETELYKIWTPRQIEYKNNRMSEALRAGFKYLDTDEVTITSYTVTDRLTGEKQNIKVG